jgi:putative SOS response-associated peptidase YedK
MCGRFTLTSSEEQIAAVLPDLVFDFDVQPRYNIAPTQPVPTVLNVEPKRVQAAHWGLIPHWAKDASIGSRMINARAETLHEKPAFKRPLKRQRCVILADGFYEWKPVSSGKKQPFYIRLRGGGLFFLAGLWDRWRSPEGQEVLSATIVTTHANELVAPLHNRMPVILRLETTRAWLAPGELEADEALALLAPLPAEAMELFPVSTAVNRPAIDDPSCIRRVDQPNLFEM